jgi:hypothetical protein
MVVVSQAAGKPLGGGKIALPGFRKSLIPRLSTCGQGRFYGAQDAFFRSLVNLLTERYEDDSFPWKT